MTTDTQHAAPGPLALAAGSALDGTARLCRVLYGRKEEPRDYIGGSDARMLHDAVDEIEKLRGTREQHRAYAHMMQEQRSQIAAYCRTLEKQIEALSPNVKDEPRGGL